MSDAEQLLRLTQDDGRTHWDECWRVRGHHGCAVARAELAHERIATLEAWRQRIEARATSERVNADRANAARDDGWYPRYQTATAAALALEWALLELAALATPEPRQP